MLETSQVPQKKKPGRKPVGKNRRYGTRKVDMVVEVAWTDEGLFEGDSLSFLTLCYKHPKVPLPIRVDCAKTVIAYEHKRKEAEAKGLALEGGIVIQVVSGVPRTEEDLKQIEQEDGSIIIEHEPTKADGKA